jgi:adenylate kinase family enzyme
MQRVLVLGSPGSGKSAFARQLAATTGLPVVHLDQLFWEPGWVQAPKNVYLERLDRALAQERWIIDGNYTSSLDLRLPRADRIILMDRSRVVCLMRIGQRIASSYGTVRADMARGCPERLDWEFLQYVWNFPIENWPQTLAAIGRHGAWERTTTLKSDGESAAFLQAARSSAGPN